MTVVATTSFIGGGFANTLHAVILNQAAKSWELISDGPHVVCDGAWRLSWTLDLYRGFHDEQPERFGGPCFAMLPALSQNLLCSLLEDVTSKPTLPSSCSKVKMTYDVPHNWAANNIGDYDYDLVSVSPMLDARWWMQLWSHTLSVFDQSHIVCVSVGAQKFLNLNVSKRCWATWAQISTQFARYSGSV